MRTLTIEYTVYNQHDKPVFAHKYRASFSGELAPQILRAGINMINSEAKLTGYYTITDIYLDNVPTPESDTFRDERLDPFSPVGQLARLEDRNDEGTK